MAFTFLSLSDADKHFLLFLSDLDTQWWDKKETGRGQGMDR